MRKMKRLMACLCACVMTLGFVSCVEEIQQETTTEFKSSDIPEVIPYAGGTYTVSLEKVVVTKAVKVNNTDIAWAYRVNYDGVEGEAIVSEVAAESVEVVIEHNHSACTREVVVEFSSDAQKTWMLVAKATQEYDPAEVEDVHSDFESTSMPELVHYNGGEFTFKVKFRNEKPVKSGEPQTNFLPWAYRVNCGGEVGEIVKVNEPTEEFTFSVDANYTSADREIVIEFSDAKAENWVAAHSAKQESALIELGEDGITYFYAKADLLVKNGKYALADSPTQSGYFFHHENKLAVPSDPSYAGYAYNPDQVSIGLADIQKNVGEDPCTALSPELRMPSYEELYNLYYFEDVDNIRKEDGVEGMHFRGSKLFLGYHGYVNIESGKLEGVNQYGGWWGLGCDYDGRGLVFTANTAYTLNPSYDFSGQNLAAVRCVKNIAMPTYISSDFTELTDSKSTSFNVVVNPGDYKIYTVSLLSDLGPRTSSLGTDTKTTIKLTIPENKEAEENKWKLYVNYVFTGIEFVQPALSDYVKLVSITPEKDQEYTSFTISVEVETDRENVPVKVSGSNGVEYSDVVSKDKTKVDFVIPENTSSTKVEWTVSIDGTNVSKPIVQAGAPAKQLSVEWSKGFLTVKDGAYTFMEPTERGTYFKHNSKWAIMTTEKFPGEAYGPTVQTYSSMADVPYGDVDPCSLVAPANTWRIPTVAECEELFTCQWEKGSDKVYTFTLPDNSELKFRSGGQLMNSTGKVSLIDSSVVFWTSENHDTDDTKAKYVMMGFTSSSEPKIAAGSLKVNGLHVRCVKSVSK